MQVVEHLSSELQVHRDLLTIQRDDRTREIEELRRDVEQQRHQLANYQQTIQQLRTLIDDFLHQMPINISGLHYHSTAGPVFPTGLLSKRQRHSKY